MTLLQLSARIKSCVPHILFILAVCLRIPFASKMLYHHDSVNFALALDHYDLRLHQPHPPGYLLYVLLGRLVHLVIPDANLALITISIIFTSLTVVVIYFLGKEMYDYKTAVIASLLAIASPNLWFHGEVALTYGVEGFFSTVIGYLCWKIHKGRGDLLFLSALLLGLAGGFRQNTCVFLLPLWLFSVRQLPLRRIVASLALLAALCAAWLVATVWATGGMTVYTEAFGNLWNSNTGHNSVFEKGWSRALLYGRTILSFSVCSLGGGIAVMVTALYGVARGGATELPCRGKWWFYLGWILPSYLFYQLIFIHPANPGYLLILLPPFLLLCSRAVIRTSEVLERTSGRPCTVIVTAAVVLMNGGIFLYSDLPASWRVIKTHDRCLATIVRELRGFNPETTAMILTPSIMYGFRMIMYYLPQYNVYNLDSNAYFWGVNRRTVLSGSLVLPANLKDAATIEFRDRGHLNRRKVPGTRQVWIVSAPAPDLIKALSGATR
jgi:hypothetical protein